MKKFLRILLYFFLGIVVLLVVFLLGFNLYYGILNSKAKSKLVEVKVLTENGYNYRDLNKNGKLDVVFGKFNPTGKLPFELPSSIEAVTEQKEDVPCDY